MVIGPAGKLAECRAKACSVIEMRWNKYDRHRRNRCYYYYY